MIPESFHFLRPAWLLALAPLALVLWAIARSDQHGSAWRRLVDQHLLRHLVLADADRARRWPLAAGALAGLAASVALAGPTWQQIPQPTFRSIAPTVVVLDMSPSMNADDLSPSRLARARHKLQDILDRTRGGQVGLVLYTDEPFVAAPLTDDARVIAEMIPTLESGLMPLRPGRADRAIAQAQALLDQAGARSGRVVLITDGGDENVVAASAAARALAASGRTLSVLGAGTDAGAPLRDLRGRIVADHDGKPVLTRLDRSSLEALASAGGGAFSELRTDDTDLATLLPALAGGVAWVSEAAQSGSSAQFDLWRDAGVWLVLIPLLLAPLAFRRGLVAAVALTLLAASSASAETSAWSDLWSRRDQQAEAARAAGNAAEAATLFEHPGWKAAATYESGNFAESSASYAQLEGDDNRYNLGNALARAGKLEDALGAYDKVLASVPDHADAKFNRDLVQRRLDEQRKQQKQQEQQEKNQQQDGQGEQQQDAQNEQGGGEDAKQAADQQQAQQGQGSEQQQQQQQQQDQQAPNEQSQSAQAGGAQPEQQPSEQQQGEAAQAQGAHGEAAPDDDRAASARDEASVQPSEQQQEQQAARAGASGQEESDARDDASARAAKERNETAQQDRSLAQGLDQALQGDDEAKEHEQKSEQGADADTASATGAKRPLSEREQAREQALRNIPDDPGGLLRAKIRRQYAEKRYSQQEVIPSW